jgi:hypothetical protein
MNLRGWGSWWHCQLKHRLSVFHGSEWIWPIHVEGLHMRPVVPHHKILHQVSHRCFSDGHYTDHMTLGAVAITTLVANKS